MRHQNSGRKFSRSSSHRKAMFRNMVTSLIEHERITTTEPKAKELRRFAEKTISISLRLGDLLNKPKDQRTPAEQGKYIHALRMASRMIRTREVLHKLFDDVAPALAGRNGGYTRIIKMGQRTGDAAPMAIIELVSAKPPVAKGAKAAPTATGTGAGTDSVE
jgi:large subunit ribosomal protein L17